MGRPSSPRAWLRWAIYTLEAQARPFSPRFDRAPGTDPRLRDTRETALSVKIMAERASAACSRNGLGCELLVRYYVLEAPWESFNATEKRIIRKTGKAFAQRLRDAGFIEGKGKGTRPLLPVMTTPSFEDRNS